MRSITAQQRNVTLYVYQIHILLAALKGYLFLLGAKMDILATQEHALRCEACAYGQECAEYFNTDTATEYAKELVALLEDLMK